MFALLLLLQAAVLPDSPRWLLAHDRAEEASDVLARLAGPGIDVNDEVVVSQRKEIEASIELESRGGLLSIFFQRRKVYLTWLPRSV